MIGAAHVGIIAARRAAGGGGVSGHRRWRLYFPNTENDYLNIAEVEMYSTVGGSNVCVGGTATASSENSTYYASNAFDGNTGTIWAVNVYTGAHWLEYDFGVEKDIVKFKIVNSAGNPKSFVKLQHSDDGSTWTDATPLMAAGRGMPMQSQSYAVGGVKSYWRLYITANQASGYTNIAELEFRESVGGPDVSSPEQPGRVSSSYGGSTNEQQTIDNNPSNYWESISITPHWIWFAFGRDVELAELSLQTGPYAGESPKDFQIQYSGDGVNWTTAATVVGSTGWTAWSVREFAV